MKVVKTIAEMKAARRGLKGTVGFVPTMGYLHEGHLSLVRKSVEENDYTAVSIFVNPTQFGPGEDLEKYPHDLERDLDLLAPIKTDIVFVPTRDEIYPPGYMTWVTVEKLTDPLEGSRRPGHFRGVTTVVNKLFNIVEPTRSYFGQKDAQQALVLTKMALDLNMPLEVITLPTVREPDGLAMSSRNVYLSSEQRKQATAISRSLILARDMFDRGERNTAAIKGKMAELIEKEPLAKIDYISVAGAYDLGEQDIIKTPTLISMVVKFGKTRLLDNIILK